MLALVRTVCTTAALGLVYGFAPMSDPVHDGIPLLVGSLVLLVALTVWHVRAVSRSAYPGVRAIEALATSLPFLLLSFAAAYYMLEGNSVPSFGTALTRLDALYFSVTVFATVGFGDITAHSQLARGVVTGQMIIDFLYVGIVVRVLLGAIKIGRGASGSAAD
jgi:voltage-gated potassium channel